MTSDETSTTPVYSDAGLKDLEHLALSKRGLTAETCRKFGYGIDDAGNQRATYCDREGRPVAQKVRTADKRFWVDGDAARMTLFGQHLWDPGRQVVVTEGELDAMSMSQVQNNRWPVVSVPQGAQSAAKFFRQELEWLEAFERVVIMFDQDDPGQEAARECAAILSPGKACIAKLPLKDASDMLQARRHKELVEAMWSAPVWTPEDLAWGDAVWDRIENYEEPEGLPWPMAGLNRLTGRLRYGELAVVCAGSGVGKSTWLREVAASFAGAGTKVGYIAMEETMERAAIGFLSVALSRPLHLGGVDAETRAEMREAWGRLGPNLVLYDGLGRIGIKDLLAKVRYLAKGAGCRVVFVDHLSKILSSNETADERRTIDLVMDELASVAVETGAAVVIISHLKRLDSRSASHEEGGRVRLDHLRGSGAIGQLAFDVIALERNQQSDSETRATVRVLKCRHTGRTGVAGYLEYNRETGRLLECSGPTESEDF